MGIITGQRCMASNLGSGTGFNGALLSRIDVRFPKATIVSGSLISIRYALIYPSLFSCHGSKVRTIVLFTRTLYLAMDLLDSNE